MDRRDAPEVTQHALIAALDDGEVLGADGRGNVKIAMDVVEIRLTAVVDPDDAVVITVWRE